jgi:hypothetical protein
VARACCPQPSVRIIRVADVEAGLRGLDDVLRAVRAKRLTDEEAIRRDLLSEIRKFGNYISPSRESDYADALLHEYRKYLLLPSE